MSFVRASVLFAVTLAAGCSEKVNVNVTCIATSAPAVECDVKQTAGKAEVEVCWDYSATCGNGSVVKAARTCQKVKDGGTVKATIGADKLTGIAACTGSTPPTAKLENVTINGEAPE